MKVAAHCENREQKKKLTRDARAENRKVGTETGDPPRLR